MLDALKLTKDRVAGAMFVCIGLAAIWIARGYEFGTPRAMGPGFMPIVLGATIAGLGVVLAIRDVLRGPGEAIGKVAVRPLVAVAIAIIAFSQMIRPLGLVASVLAVVIIARLAGDRLRPLDTLILGILLAGFCTLIFVWALSIPLRIFPWS